MSIADLDALDLTDSKVKPREQRREQSQTTTTRGVFYFDLETVPDYERADLFDLEPIPEPAKRTTLDQCPAVDEVVKGTLEEFKVTVTKLNPVDEFLTLIDATEKASKKPRKGIFDLTAGIRNQDADRESLIVAQRKQMSVTPEFCKIVALGWAAGESQVNSMVVGVDGVDEERLLHEFWDYVRSAKSICGFNILNFDLPVIFIRSILLDVAPSRQFDTKPWGTDIIDLMQKRFPRSGAMGLKRIAKLMGVDVPAGDVDGSQVEKLWMEDPAKVGEYVRSDIEITREIHRKYSGYFC